MSESIFYMKTNLYKEYLLLDVIERNKDITQRSLAKLLGSSVSMVNSYLDGLVKKKYLSKEVLNSKRVNYHITDKGIERKRYLNIGYLKQAFSINEDAKREVMSFIEEVSNKGFKDVIFYGAGEVCEILLRTIKETNNTLINVIGIIDDDINKHGSYCQDVLISSNKLINKINHDAVMITSYTNKDSILNNLVELSYSKDKVLYFFK